MELRCLHRVVYVAVTPVPWHVTAVLPWVVGIVCGSDRETVVAGYNTLVFCRSGDQCHRYCYMAHS